MLNRKNSLQEWNSTGRVSGSGARAVCATWWLAIFMLAFLMIPGCSGCNDEPMSEEAKAAEKAKLEAKKKEKLKPDFEPPKLTVVPQKTSEAAIRPVKPGHWTAAIEEIKANNSDFVGQLYAEVR